MATSLPREMWDIIVAQIPPPEPKLVPMMWFVPNPHQYTDDKDQIYISKAVSEKEATMIGRRAVEMVEEDDVAWWFSFDNEFQFTFANTRARMLVWDYATNADRAAHAAKQPYYMTRAKKN